MTTKAEKLDIATKALKKISRAESLGRVNGKTVWPWYAVIAKDALKKIADE